MGDTGAKTIRRLFDISPIAPRCIHTPSLVQCSCRSQMRSLLQQTVSRALEDPNMMIDVFHFWLAMFIFLNAQVHGRVSTSIHQSNHTSPSTPVHTIRPLRLSEGQSYTPYASMLPKYALNIYGPKWRKADLQACRHPGTDFPGSKLRNQETPTRNSRYGRKPLWYQEVPWKYLMDMMHQFGGFIISTSAGLTYISRLTSLVPFASRTYRGRTWKVWTLRSLAIEGSKA